MSVVPEPVLDAVAPVPSASVGVAAPMRGGSFTLIGLLLLVPLVFWPTALSLGSLWADTAGTTYVHGSLLLAVSLWLVWRNGINRPVLVLDLQPAAAVLLFISGVAWAWSVQAGIGILAMLLLLLTAALAALTFFGQEGYRRSAFPVLLLLFATPLWGSFNGLLQWATVYAVQFSLLIAGIPVAFEANRVDLAAGSFEIAGGCSGLHFMISALAIAALLGELNQDTLRRRCKLLVLAAGMALVMNWLRVFAIILIGQLTQMQHYIVAKSHYEFGWMLFAVMVVLFLFIERRIPWQVANTLGAGGPPTSTHPMFPPQAAAGGARTGALVAAFLALLLPGLMRVLAARPVEASTAVPRAPAGWEMTEVPQKNGWHPRYDGVDQFQLARYERPTLPFVEAYAGAWGYMSPERKFGGYFNSPLPGAVLLDADAVTLNGWHAHRMRMRDTSGNEWVILVGYDVAGRPFDSALQAQLWYGISSLGHQHSLLSRVFVLRSPCKPHCGRAENALSQFHAATGGAY